MSVDCSKLKSVFLPLPIRCLILDIVGTVRQRSLPTLICSECRLLFRCLPQLSIHLFNLQEAIKTLKGVDESVKLSSSQ